MPYCASGGYCLRIWEVFKQSRDAEEMITMTMGDVNLSQLLGWDRSLDPRYEIVCLGDGDGRIDENRFFGAVDQSAGYGRPETTGLAIGFLPRDWRGNIDVCTEGCHGII